MSPLVEDVDGQHFGTHGAAHLPERPMSINFNQWPIGLEGQPSTTPRAYDQQVDYVPHVKDQALTPAQVNAMVWAYRGAGTSFEDTVPAGQRRRTRRGSRAGRGPRAAPAPLSYARRRPRHRLRTPAAGANFPAPP